MMPNRARSPVGRFNCLDELISFSIWLTAYEISKNGGLCKRKWWDFLAEFDIETADIINCDSVRACCYISHPYIQYM